MGQDSKLLYKLDQVLWDIQYVHSVVIKWIDGTGPGCRHPAVHYLLRGSLQGQAGKVQVGRGTILLGGKSEVKYLPLLSILYRYTGSDHTCFFGRIKMLQKTFLGNFFV